MEKKFELMPEEVLSEAVSLYQECLVEQPLRAVICDDTITPFSRAMKTLGFTPIDKKDCPILRLCTNDLCKQSYSASYLKDSAKYWACPHCQRITKH
jgi:hypothetical protein